MKPLAVPNTSDIDEITKHFDNHISVCKIKEAYSEILREDNFSSKMVSMKSRNKFWNSTQKNLPSMVPSLQVS